MKVPHQSPTTVQELTTDHLAAIAEKFIAEGWKVFPVAGKIPVSSHGVHDATDDLGQFHEMLRRAYSNPTGVAGACDGLLVVDVDPRNGGSTPEDLPPTRVHQSGRGDGGAHLIYRLPAGTEGLKSSTSDIAPGVDVKTGAGSYVLLPGSTHPDSGKPYESNDAPITAAPTGLLEKLKASKEESKSKYPLSYLLNHPPEVGGRNEWLTRVAGHYAKQYRLDEETYWSSVMAANRLLRSPMDEDEVLKTTRSIWQTERDSFRDPALEDALDESNGWLVSGEDCIRTLAYVGSGKERQALPFDLCTFDLQVLARMWDPNTEEWSFDCRVNSRYSQREQPNILIHAHQLGDPRMARKVFAKRSLSVKSGGDLVHNELDWASRLLAYLENQDAPTLTIAHHLGWSTSEEGYLTSEGVITQAGVRSYQAQVADPRLRNPSTSYGFESSSKRAREILAEVLHFQDPTTVALFGSWWAATLVKQWISPRVSLFPVMALEAASGSGKTTGFFSIMSDLSGSTRGEGHYTRAVLRDLLAENLNGLVWVDDMDRPDEVMELVRVLTGDGSITKKGSDYQTNVQVELVGSLLLSGESLGIQSQRALVDRFVRVSPPPPESRRSIHDPSRPQWDDVVRIQDELRDLGGGATIAGHFLQVCAGLSSKVSEWFEQERRVLTRTGRSKDRDLVLLVGARVLEHLVGDVQLADGDGTEMGIHEWVISWFTRNSGKTLEQVIDDVAGGAALNCDNTVTTRLLPAYLASIQGRENFEPKPAAVTDGTSVWVSANRLAAWVSAQNHGRVDFRTESADSIREQLAQLRWATPEWVIGSQQKRLGGSNVKCYQITGDVAAAILQRVDYY